ncbi:tear acid lipase-like protein [Amblyomma americanum]
MHSHAPATFSFRFNMRARRPLGCITWWTSLLCVYFLSSGTLGSASNVEREAKMTTCGLVTHMGFHCDTSEAETEDGYVIEVDRVRHTSTGDRATPPEGAQGRSPVLLVPGILCDSGSWFVNYPSQSPGFALAERNYDVWAMNTRETPSRSRHKSLSQRDPRYWRWSFDEVGRYDVAAVIDHVLNKTSAPRLTLLSFSQGFLASLVLLSTRPEYNKKVNLFIGYAPVGNLTHVGYPVSLLMKFSDPLLLLFDPMKTGGYLTLPGASKDAAELACSVLNGQPCSLGFFLTLLNSPKQLNKTRTPVYLAHSLIGTSYQNLRHFTQVSKSKNLVMYDHGFLTNIRLYGKWTAPSYPLERINVPLLLFSSKGDTVADRDDVADLVRNLRMNVLRHYVVPPETFRHMDFMLGCRASVFLHDVMIDTLDQCTHENMWQGGACERTTEW